MAHKKGRDCVTPSNFRKGQSSWSCPVCGNTFTLTPPEQVRWSQAGSAGHVRKANGQKAGFWGWLTS